VITQGRSGSGEAKSPRAVSEGEGEGAACGEQAAGNL
jgi:hypothetical protein